MKPLLVAHRGASRERPENTLSALLRAKELGADRVEVDVHRSSDDVVVVHHDADLLRSAGLALRIRATPHAELAQARLRYGRPEAAPERIPTLREAIEAARPVPLVVEVKGEDEDPAALCRLVLDELARGSPEGAAIISFADAAVEEALRRWPRERVGLVRETGQGEHRWRDCLTSGAGLAVLERPWLRREIVDELRLGGRAVYCYCLDSEAEVERGVALGLAGIISNDPRTARSVLG